MHQGSGDRRAPPAQGGWIFLGCSLGPAAACKPSQLQAPKVRNSPLAEEQPSPLTSPSPPPCSGRGRSRGNSLHPFTDNAALLPARLELFLICLLAKIHLARAFRLAPSLPGLSGELVYCWVQGNHDLRCLLSPLAPCPWERRCAGTLAGDTRGDTHRCAGAKAKAGQGAWVLILLCPWMRKEVGGTGILQPQEVILIRPVPGFRRASAGNLDVGAEY